MEKAKIYNRFWGWGWNTKSGTTYHTACTKGFFDTENDIKKVTKSTTYISEFCALKILMKFKLFLLHRLQILNKFKFHWTFQGTKFANIICTFYYLLYILFCIKKAFYAGCVNSWGFKVHWSYNNSNPWLGTFTSGRRGILWIDRSSQVSR